ncbi:hypothetical protein [Streptomyces sp. NPDC004592]
MAHTQGEIPESIEPVVPEPMSVCRDTTAVDGRIPAALLHELADELGQFDDLPGAGAEGTRQPDGG